MSDNAPRRVKDLPLTRLLPNLLTLLSLCSGLTGIRFALLGKWQEAALAIVIAGVFDMLDGRVARMLNIASKFGAELDSLADAISFGVAPGFVMYEWTLKDETGFGWAAVLVYAVCTVLRLARFNTMLEEPPDASRKNYFVGLSAPGGAGLAILPLVLTFQFGEEARLPAVAIGCWMIILGGLMVSRFPTLSIKGLRIAPSWVSPMFLVVVLLIGAMITNPWLTLSCVGIAYAISMPCGWIVYRMNSKRRK